MIVAAALAGLVAALVLPLPGLTTPEPGAPTATAVPTRTGGTPTPTTRPTATMPSDPEVILERNPVYAIAVPARCPEQRPPTSRAAFRSQVKALVACANAAWKKALARTPVAFAKPKVSFYSRSTSSPCGHLGDSFPAAYCSTDRTLYFATAAYRQGRYYRLAVAHFVMHEYAHHVQELAGIFDSSWTVQEKAATTTRRVELQAHCMAQYALTHSGLDFGSQDRADAEYQFGYTNDADGHGSVKAERYWGRRGLGAATIGACNTWKVASSKVK